MKKRILSLALALITALSLLPTATAVDTSYKTWAQGDSRWGSMSISSAGYTNYSNTMGGAGCYVTAVAKLLVHAGQQSPDQGFTPRTCLEWMLNHGMLDGNGGMRYGNFNNSFLPTYGSQLYKENSDAHEKDPWNKGQAIDIVGGKIRNGYYVIVCVYNKESGNTHYMAVDYVSDDIYVMDNGGVVPLYGTRKYSGGVIDQVYFKYSGPHPYPAADYIDQISFATIQPGLYSLAPACAPDSRLEVADGSTAIQANVHIGNASNDTAQQWEISALGDEHYKLISKKSGLALDVTGAGTTAGTNVQQYWWTENKAQHWAFIDTGDGYYEIVTRLNAGLRLDVNGGAATDRTNVQIWTANHGAPQKWKLIPVTSEPGCDKGHTWGSWATTKEVSLGVAGQRKRTCSVCGKTETEAIPALTQKPNGVINTKVQYRYHRYESDSGDYFVCADLGLNYYPSMHLVYSKWVDTPYPEVKKGYNDYLVHPRQDGCTRAGCLDTDPYEVHRHEAPDGTVWYYEETRVCHELAGGGEYYSYAEFDCVKGHTWGEWETVKKATCATDGQQKRSCSVCGQSETKSIPALAHDYKTDRETDTIVYYVCASCGDSCQEIKRAPSSAMPDEPSIPSTKPSDPSATPSKTPAESNMGSLPLSAIHSYTSGFFRDIKPTDWFYGNVADAYAMGLMNGTGSGTFSPGNNMTIAEAVTLAARIHNLYYNGEESFTRYDGGSWYDPYVDYARENHIIDMNYNYTRPATREEFVHILAKALPETELENIAGTVHFADSQDIVYIFDVELLSGAGVINGIPEGGKVYFKPNATITRAEVAAIVARMAKPDSRIK